MKNQNSENQKLKLSKIEEELRELWECLSPSEQKRRSVFYKFYELQKIIQIIRIRNQILNKKEITNEQSI